MDEHSDFELLEVLWEHRMVTDAEDRYLERINNKQPHRNNIFKKTEEKR